MSLLDYRQTWKPLEYPQAEQYWLQQQQAHWLHTEIAMASDVNDWKVNLSESEKNVIGNVLKGFTQTEIVVNDYWAKKVAQWFPKPEIVMMATTFANMETIHAKAYAYLNESLGLEDFDAFLYEPTAKAKIDYIVNKGNSTRFGDLSREDIASSLAVFSGFTEGVNLFSSFAILMHFSRRNLLKGVGQIVSFSVKDESLHAIAGSWLFREFIKENPDIWTDELKKTIYEAARTSVALEDDFIDKVFERGPIEGLSPHDLKQYIRFRANTRLGDLGLKQNWKNIDKEALKRMDWFDFLLGVEHQDFFAGRVSAYSRGIINWDKMYDGE